MSAKKKGKASKADKEKAQKEEQKRRQKEEEEERLRKEQEERERLERERLEREKQQMLEEKDRGRRADELEEVRRMLEDNQTAVNKWEAEVRERAKWARYMRCDGTPNPSIPQEINTFINLWREDPEVQIGPVLEDNALALQLIEELESLINNRGDSEQSKKETERDKETLRSLQDLIHCKLRLASEEMLKWSSVHADAETGNMHKVIQDKNITLCLWANLSKNSRLKEFCFEEVGLAFEVPKQLAVSDVAVRILHTHYDHLSGLSWEVQSRRRESAAKVEEAPPVAEKEQEEQGDEESKEDGQRGEEDVKPVKSAGSKSAISVSSEKEEKKSTPLQEAEEGGIGGENLTEDTGAADPVPSAPEPETDALDADIVDLRQYTPLGGVFYFDVFWLPPQSKLVSRWEMRELKDSGLQPFPYPAQPQTQNTISGKEDTSAPIGVSIKAPDSVVFLEDPLVARWDPTVLQWRTDCITGTTYDAATKTVSFKTSAFHTFALLQDAHANMPFQSWELRPLGLNSAQLTITAAVSEVSIIIKDNQCMLTSDSGGVLSHVAGKWMSSSSLQKALSSSGVNLFVNEYSSKYVSITAKDPLTEQAMYEQMALVASTFAFSWSQWNSQCGQEHLVLQACQHLEAGPVLEGAWCLFLLGAQRFMCLEMKERSESFSPRLAEDSEFHSTFLHMLKDYMSPAGWSRVQESHHLFVDSVYKLLCTTRVLTYS
ncbi:hypothetical protein MATL_G00249340 [Megalops atlanticus]|uniref:Dynein axonemal intermediate chain 7 n=1 Tax=Megalops atlanticus TaxID=7932 RepID=A0A9D3PBG2_MEGAT|nr:hypothetical protein MATL_G00249340 [Megalops atlanticus]